MRFLLPALGLLAMSTLPSSGHEEKGKKVAFEEYHRYFVKNTVKLTDNAGFFVAQDKKEFDEIFNIGFTMGKKPKLVDDKLFETHTIVAAVKSGSTLWKYEVEDVRLDKKQLIVQYKTSGKESTAKVAVPLILAVPRGEFTEVVFIENGKEVGKVDAKK
jgi:hypothetical protein